jgi:hypothetical protein
MQESNETFSHTARLPYAGLRLGMSRRGERTLLGLWMVARMDVGRGDESHLVLEGGEGDYRSVVESHTVGGLELGLAFHYGFTL